MDANSNAKATLASENAAMAKEKKYLRGADGSVLAFDDPNLYASTKAQTDRSGNAQYSDATVADFMQQQKVTPRPIVNPADKIAPVATVTAPEKPRTLSEIQQEQRNRGQAIIDATEGLYQEQLRALRQKGESAMKTTSSIQVGAGLAGTPFKQAAEQKTANLTEAEVNAESNRRKAEIASIMAAAEDKATTNYDREIARYQTERQFYATESDKEIANTAAATKAKRDAVKEAVTGYAKAGYSLDEVPDLDRALADAGMSRFEAVATWGANNPKSGAKTEVKDGNVITYYVDPRTGKAVVSTEKLPAELQAPDVDIATVVTDDGVFAYNRKDPEPKMMKIGSKKAEEKKAEPPITKEIGGRTKQWNEATGTWEDPKVSGSTATAGASVADINKMPEASRLRGIAEVNTAIDNYAKLIEEKGTAGVFSPSDRQKLNAAKESINLAVKNAEGLGALQAPDIELITRMIPDVTREGIWQNLVSGPIGALTGGAGRALDTLKQVKGQYGEKAKMFYDSLIAQGASPNDHFIQSLAQNAGLEVAAPIAGTPPAPSKEDIDKFKAQGFTDDEIREFYDPKADGGEVSAGPTTAKTIAAAIKKVESGGNYKAKGASGENGAYQFMPETWKGWAKQYLGDANAPLTPENQDKVAEMHIQSLLDQGKTPEQIALIWNGGQPVRKKGTNRMGVKYDSGAYADKVLANL